MKTIIHLDFDQAKIESHYMIKDKMIIHFDWNQFMLKGFHTHQKCPQCGLQTAQQLLTSFLCANYRCNNYDKKFFADTLKDHIKSDIQDPAGVTILKDQIKITIVDDTKFDIDVPFTVN